MFCPNCKAEYIRGIPHCSDCNVSLVEALPDPDRDSDGELIDAKLKEAWRGQDMGDCLAVCKQLSEAGIPFKVHQHSTQFLKGVDEHYEIGAPLEFVKRVEEIIDGKRLAAADATDDSVPIELTVPGETAKTSRIYEAADSAHWNPEDATVEVCTERTSRDDSMVELSFRENGICYRVDVLDDRSRKIFVAPADKIPACEIVHEIYSGDPKK